MNVLFISLSPVPNINEHGIYSDLLREFIKNGHNISVVTPCFDKKTEVISDDKVKIVKVNIGSVFETNLIKKGINTLLIGSRYMKAVKKYLSDICFDLILYPTPPVTIASVVEYVKKRDNAKTYLMLKDIFPQNAVDIGTMTTTGIKGIIYKFFKNKEKKLYAVSDYIGCMSPANAEYLLAHNPEIKPEKVEICPNSVEPIDMTLSEDEKIKNRTKYNLPLDKKIFVYGGNLGKPQGVPFILECLKAVENTSDVFFLIVGNGTEYKMLESFINTVKPGNVLLMSSLPKEDYDLLVASCDVGLIFLDYRFTIPNFPSRLLGYMQAGLPVLACTDSNTDIGKIILDNGFGWWCESNNPLQFRELCESAAKSDIATMQKKALEFFVHNYTSEISYNIIMERMKNEHI